MRRAGGREGAGWPWFALYRPADSAIVPAESVSGDDPGDLLARRIASHIAVFDRRATISPRSLADAMNTLDRDA